MTEDYTSLERQMKLYKQSDMEKTINYLRERQIAQNLLLQTLRQDVNMLQAHREQFFNEMKEFVEFLTNKKLHGVKKITKKKKL